MIIIKTYFIQEKDNHSKIFNFITIKNNTITLPVNKKDILTKNKKMIKLVKKTIKTLNKKNIKTVVLSNELQKNENIINLINSSNMNILDGRWLFKYISYETIDYILKNKNIQKEETEISILTNELTDTSIENIKLFSKEYKRVNVITNHISSFIKIEEKLFDEYGIMIIISNNKKKSLVNSSIILNLDFPKEILNKYNINENAIIINAEGNMKIYKKRFNGIVINDYEIELENLDDTEINKLQKFNLKEIYESKIYRKDNFYNIRNIIKDSGLKIKYLKGNNGIITKY